MMGFKGVRPDGLTPYIRLSFSQSHVTFSILAASALALTGCAAPSQTSAEVANANAAAEWEAQQQAIAAVALQAHRTCISNTLNNTIYKSQTDRDFEAALFTQNMENCPTDFVGAFVRLRNAARIYLRVSQEILTHQGHEDEAYKKDGLNILCSLVAGTRCADSYVGEWETLSATLKSRAEAAKLELDSAKANIETVIAEYGLYVGSVEQPKIDAENAL